MSYQTIKAFTAPEKPQTEEEPPRDKVLYWVTLYGPKKRANLEDYWDLSREFRVPLEEIATRMDRSTRTLWRWESIIQEAIRAAREADQ